ncbi:hypothetical protein B0T22DRAFT_378229 [Podospora appendiculata]|uniref:Zn(2)-C6 fungal-type domain-containing protein n=1 Tax=Podospora appendiculata TaxID=314037 RepID=A0AAE0X8R4_9PEZI|nr:hypothetical protein B0T22DRAFT_378229 [Podospora appendiculata]
MRPATLEHQQLEDDRGGFGRHHSPPSRLVDSESAAVPHLAPAASLASDSSASANQPNAAAGAGAGAGAAGSSEPPVNPRKRKKASRACDFCHVNHQPCDNGKPKCGVCQKHNKPCLYLRPTKRRGPQKGYRTALNTYKESAAAWGAVLGAIPGLDALIEGHLRASNGKSVVSSIKDASQQDALISRWQESSVFKAFFGHNGGPSTNALEDIALQSQDVDDDELSGGEDKAPLRPALPNRLLQSAVQRSHSSSSSPFAVPGPGTPPHPPESAFRRRADSTSLSDIVARDAAQGSSMASHTLASLGFAPDETILDFYNMGSNPEPIPRPNDGGFDPALGSESEQRAYYELLMGRSFPG